MLRRATRTMPLTRALSAAGARVSAPAHASMRMTGIGHSVLRAQSAVSWQTPRAMHFSSSPPDKPTIFDGIDGLVQYYNRCTERTGVFERYEREGVFPPSNARFSNFFLFTKLQLPPRTEIDAVEFLNGAQFACDLAMHTMYSREFVNFACGAITESRAASHLQRGLSHECFDAFVFAMGESSKSGNTFDLTQLDILGVHLVGVEWERLTVADYKAEQVVANFTDDGAETGTSTSSTPNKSESESEPVELIEPSDYHTMVQRMRLDVLLETKEHLDVRTADGQDQTIARDSSAVWRFESLVTTPDDVDWKIVSVI